MKEYNIKELTPKNIKRECLAVGCPAIYEITPTNMVCGFGACSSVYDNGGDYLIIGEKIEAREFGLVEKVGKGEVLIRVSKKLIDEMERLKIED